MENDENCALLVGPPLPNERRSHKDYMHRVGGFAEWLTATGRRWDQPDLPAYREYLLDERQLAPSTVNVHLSTIRARYRVLLEDGTLLDELARWVSESYPPDERQQHIDDALQRIEEVINPAATRVTVKPPDVKYLRLTHEHVKQLLDSPGTRSLVGIRDTAIVALLFTTGIRASELCMLNVPDLYHVLGGEPALHVPPGRGCTERLVPYGGLRWGLEYVNTWLLAAEITDGPVFRGFYKGGRAKRDTRLTTQSLDNILASYPITIKGRAVIIRPMDLRRAYTRTLYQSGLNMAAIAANLGLKNINAVRDYLGSDAQDTRVPPPFKAFD